LDARIRQGIANVQGGHPVRHSDLKRGGGTNRLNDVAELPPLGGVHVKSMIATALQEELGLKLESRRRRSIC
jgi:hypothetical protein